MMRPSKGIGAARRRRIKSATMHLFPHHSAIRATRETRAHQARSPSWAPRSLPALAAAAGLAPPAQAKPKAERRRAPRRRGRRGAASGARSHPQHRPHRARAPRVVGAVLVLRRQQEAGGLRAGPVQGRRRGGAQAPGPEDASRSPTCRSPRPTASTRSPAARPTSSAAPPPTTPSAARRSRSRSRTTSPARATRCAPTARSPSCTQFENHVLVSTAGSTPFKPIDQANKRPPAGHRRAARSRTTPRR